MHLMCVSCPGPSLKKFIPNDSLVLVPTHEAEDLNKIEDNFEFVT